MSRRLILGLILLTALAPIISLPARPVAAQSDALFAHAAFRAIWAQADQSVASGATQRTWLWGPGPVTSGLQERYREATRGQRLVQYFDKSRMEDNAWRSSDSLWRVTNGLLVVEMVSGQQQVGDARFEPRPAAAVSVAGDPGSGPTYADLVGLLGRPTGVAGQLVTARLLAGGSVVEDQPAPAAVVMLRPDASLQHAIAEPFWQFMTGPASVDGQAYFATGLPITEPYWTEVRVAGQARWVLLQAFERRVLTYTPGNPAGFVVEMGNVGRHYYEWRYGQPPPGPNAVLGPLQPTPLVIPAALRDVVNAQRERRFVDQTLNLPAGFSVSLFGLAKGPRFMAFSPAGVLHIAEPWEGTVVAMPDRDRDGVADERRVVIGGLNHPTSLAFHAGHLYVGEGHRVMRYDSDGQGGSVANPVPIVTDLPDGGQHWTRTIGIGPDERLYISVGSSCNVCVETDWKRASILQYNLDGSGGRVYAGGLRNSVGIAWQPGSGRLYATENGRDNLGDDLPPEELNEIRDGGFYGWPRCHGSGIRDPRFGTSDDACAGQIAPAVAMQAHSAPLGLTFIGGSAFPETVHGDLLVAFHGSWNRSVATGYKVVRVVFRDGQPTGQVEDFLTGFLVGGGGWSRPVGVQFGPDGALYMTDDRGGGVFRISASAASP